MIKQAQAKFICVVMALMFVLFTIIFAFSCNVLKNQYEKNIEHTLEEVYSNYILTDTVTTSNSFVAELKNVGLPFDISINYTTNQNNPFSAQKMNSVVEDATTTFNKSGTLENIYYKSYVDKTKYIITATDASLIIENYNSNVVKVAIIIIISYLILFSFIFLLSFAVFKPIKDAFVKQKEFISNASHEFKTPLTIITANAEVLKQNNNSQWVDNISSQTERMSYLVNDMLSLAKMYEQKEKPNITNFNLSEIVEGEALGYDALAFEKRKNLTFNIQPNIQYSGNLNSVKNIVNILLDNAIKHSSVNGKINLSLKKEVTKITLSVFNTGSDVPDDQSDKVFERFYRGDTSRSRQSGGSGLGLAIAKDIAKINKWKISAHSKFGQSMQITVIL